MKLLLTLIGIPFYFIISGCYYSITGSLVGTAVLTLGTFAFQIYDMRSDSV
jgi:hypothetical protein